ncbi:MAG: hypothetical protein NUV37_03170, partial [Nanoarchaeota archaeon]|nr:hypothetical protein [Nanoarchaeota archaeon]
MPEDKNQELEQIVASFRANLEFEAEEDDLVAAINKAIEESKDLKAEIDRVGKQNKLYWKRGTIKDLDNLHPKKSRITSNRIFTDIETAIPILTANPPEPTIIGSLDNAAKEVLKKALTIAYEVKYRMQQKIQHVIRHWILFRVGILKYRWDKSKGFVTEPVLAKKIGMDKRASNTETCEYIWEELEDKLEDLDNKFPKQKVYLHQKAGGDNPKTKLKYIEFWGGNGEWVAWKLGEKILDKSKNPNFDYENEENNIFEIPHFPYIFINVFNIGDETGLYDETSLIEEAAQLQEGVNQLEQQILDLNEGQKRVWIALGRAISEAKAQELVDKTGDLMIYVDRNGMPGDVQQVQSGKPDAALFNHLTHLLNEIDNTIGM